MTRAWTSELEVRTSLGSTELTLVRAVSTVVFGVALPICRDTPGIMKLSNRSSLIGCVFYIDKSNEPVVVASELTGGTGNVGTSSFVTVVTTVVFSVAAEAQRYTASSLALKLVAAAGGLGAVLHLVTVVQAIVVAVANP